MIKYINEPQNINYDCNSIFTLMLNNFDIIYLIAKCKIIYLLIVYLHLNEKIIAKFI